MNAKELAARALDIVNNSPDGSMQRRAAGCAAAVLATTKTVAAARKALEGARLDDAIRDAALALLDELAAEVAP